MKNKRKFSLFGDPFFQIYVKHSFFLCFCLLSSASHTHTLTHLNTHIHTRIPGALCLDSSAVTPHQCLRLTTITAPQPDSAVQSHVRALCLVLSYTGSVWRGSCNTCGGKWPSGFSGPTAHGWQFTTFLVQTTPETVAQYQTQESVSLTDPLRKV